jgi:predicted TIM-barrel fold metal-dependent hydrolase
MADIWAKGEGRFRWVVVLPWHGDEIEDVRQAQRAEMEFVKQNGACGVLMFGGYGNRHFSDPMFAPLFEEASRLDLPICIHAGSANVPSFNEAYQGDGDIFPIAKIPGMTAFHLLVYHNVSAKFPSLRWGFLELGASWLPYLLTDLPNRFKKLRDGQELDRYTLLRDRRIWVQCQTDEDIPYILKYAGDDNLLVGSDYGHADTSSELEALQIVKERGIKGEIDPIAAQKMLDDNARAFYGI